MRVYNQSSKYLCILNIKLFHVIVFFFSFFTAQTVVFELQAAGSYPGYDCSTLQKPYTSYTCQQTAIAGCSCADESTSSYNGQGPHGECDGEVYDPGYNGTVRAGPRKPVMTCDCHDATGISTAGYFHCNLTPAKCDAGEILNLGFCGCFTANSCTTSIIAPTVTEVSNTDHGVGSPRTQVFSISGTFIPGDILSAAVYSHRVFVVAAVGDNSTSMASKMAIAINATTSTQWLDHTIYPIFTPYGDGYSCWAYSTPYFVGQPGYKPSASSLGSNLTLILNYQNQFGVHVSRTSPVCP